eukprot:scaffold98230_cov63-Phaeocystis_antarctica.AAC.2
MASASTQLAVAAGIASIAAGVVWYLNRRATAPTATATTSDLREPATVAPERVESQIEDHDPLESTTVAGPTCTRSMSWNPEVVREELRSEKSAGARTMPTTNITASGADLCALRGAPATEQASEMSVYAPNDRGCTHILALPAEVLVLILASKPLRAAFYAPHLGRVWVLEQLTIGQALARAGTCCKPFAICGPPRSSPDATAGSYPWPAARRCFACRSSRTTQSGSIRSYAMMCPGGPQRRSGTTGIRPEELLIVYWNSWTRGVRRCRVALSAPSSSTPKSVVSTPSSSVDCLSSLPWSSALAIAGVI